MNESISGQILELVFIENIPEFVHQNIRLEQIDKRLTEFKFVVVLPLGKERKNRITWSSLGEEEYWLQVISKLLPSNKQKLLEGFPAGCRKVLDFDGEWGEIFLDDLHHEEKSLISSSAVSEQMCRIFDLQGNEVATIRKIEPPLREKLPPSILFHSCFLACLSIGGMWGIREDMGGNFLSVLWVSEAKWKGNIQQTQDLVEGQNPPVEWGQLRGLLQKKGLEIYPDGIEFFGDGRIDLSITFL